MKWNRGLVFQFWLAMNILVLISVLTISGLYAWRETAHLEDSLKNEGITAAKTLNSAIGLYMLEEDYSNLSPLTYSLQSEPNIAYVIIRDKEGTTVNQKGETNLTDLIIEKIPLEYFKVNVGEVEMGLKTTTLKKQKQMVLIDTVITVISYSLLSLIFSYIISRKMTAPIKKLILATKQLSKGHRNVDVLEEISVIEIKQLAIEFNKMAKTIYNHEEILVNEINKATKDLSKKIDMLEVFGSISNSVLEDDVQSPEIIKSTLLNIQSYMGACQVTLTFINQQKRLEVFRLEQENNTSSYELQMEDTSFSYAINQKQIIVRNDLFFNNASIFEQKLMKEGMKSLLILPIIAKNKAIGTLNIASSKKDYFSEDIIEQLTSFTNHIALAFDRVAAYESLHKSAYHDFLTGLPNFRLFKICVQDALEKAKQNNTLVAILFMDLDRFKAVNDTFGHATGDLLLKYISKQIVSCLAEGDTVSRIGGDEFTVLLPFLTDSTEAVAISKKIMKALENPVIIKGYKIPISTSIGISFFPKDGHDPDTLIKLADRAMYKVKQQGKNNYAIYTLREDKYTVNQIVLENNIRKAINKKELTVYYQPKINIQDGTVSGVEALVRWMHPEQGLISPEHFIPQAEETGLIVQIGEVVMKQACQQCVTWQKQGLPPIPVSVNLSPHQFLQSTLVSNIEKIIRDTGINPELLELEITESMSMDITRSIIILQELKALGVRIVVDDFGTGYSSLNYLRQLPIDTVKIDKSFIRDMTIDKNNEAIVATIINMAHNLNLSVTAEGAETEEQVKYLKRYLCDNIQGYYFSRPIPANDFEVLYTQLVMDAQKTLLYA
ncbi:EAL domain-containing protein [Bacillus tuaregi]|uniref:EAL domain-containing protein n=1 Tax=Bacillus tuaregi TaxID=1816695 RepID=UPI0008F805AA|nr:EAL domain-containing protein [Bacillus tuaregi]